MVQLHASVRSRSSVEQEREFPKLQAAGSIPAETSTIRARSSAEEQGVSTAKVAGSNPAGLTT